MAVDYNETSGPDESDGPDVKSRATVNFDGADGAWRGNHGQRIWVRSV